MKSIVFVISMFVLSGACSQESQFNVSKQHIGVEGYDLISYFENDPVPGRNDFSSDYQGVTYRFTSKEHLEMFKLNPEKYIPQYGGWCAYAMGVDGSKVSVNPKTYKIVNGKLFLFYNKFLTNTLNEWNKDEEALQKQADLNWNELVK